jgi:2-dehydro-3-deoxygalactonokinase
MTNPAYVAVDWGTSSFRLWLIGRDGTVLAERRSGEGMTSAAKTGFSAVLAGHLAAIEALESLPVIVCGMAGARQGWVEAGYIDVPAPLASILTGAVSVPGESRDIRILPGLAQRDVATPDVIRGEETQLLGALGPASSGAQAVCMPGTHSKWVHVTESKVTGFSTFMTGELFDVISKHTILSHAVAGAEEQPADAAAFEAARSGQLLHGISAAAAQARLSGTLVGLEIAGALQDAANGTTITLVASGRLQALYEQAFRTLSLAFTAIDADAAVRRGLSAAAEAIWPN